MTWLVHEFLADLSGEDVALACRSAMSSVGWSVKEPEPSRITARIPQTPTSNGSKIEILLVEVNPSCTSVRLTGSAFGLGPFQKKQLRGNMSWLRSAIEVAAPTSVSSQWLKDAGRALASLGLRERARNTGTQLKGIPIEGDLRLDGKLTVSIALFETDQLANDGAHALAKDPQLEPMIAARRSAIETIGRALCVVHGGLEELDDRLLYDVRRTVQSVQIPLPAGPEPKPTDVPKSAATSEAWGRRAQGDPVEQLRKLGELRDAGVLTDEEFATRKAQLLSRI